MSGLTHKELLDFEGPVEVIQSSSWSDNYYAVVVVAVQSLSCVHLFATPGTAAHRASPSCIVSLEFAQTPGHWVSGAIQPSPPLCLGGFKEVIMNSAK